jgi:ABC-type polar amino acid transport system, ATPase component
MTMIVVTHEMRFVRKLADSVHFLMNGSVVETGSPDKIFKEPDSPECQHFIESIIH